MIIRASGTRFEPFYATARKYEFAARLLTERRRSTRLWSCIPIWCSWTSLCPGMNGVEAASVLKRRLPDTRIVIFTLYADQIGDSLANALGIDLVVSKSEGGAALARALQPLLR